MAAGSPAVDIVVLNWNGREDTLDCLASLSKSTYPYCRVIVVDNGSADGSVAAIRAAFPTVEVLETGKNLGYAGGNNVGIRHALDRGTDFILLLNNDTVVAADLIESFVTLSLRTSSDDVLGAKIYYFDKPEILWFAGARWHSPALNFVIDGIGQADSDEYSQVRDADYITGCALFASAATFRQVGLLDERYFLTYEETDWCYRARGAGHRCIVVPQAKLWHKVSSSFGGESSPLVTYFMTRNRLFWARHHCSASDMRAIRRETWQRVRQVVLPEIVIPTGSDSVVRRFVWALLTWWREFRRRIGSPHNRAVLYAVRDYYLGRLGDCGQPIRRLSKQPN